MAKRHWHVHSTMPGGYLCNCDWHYPLDAAGRDDVLREEKRYWVDFKEDSPYPALIRISGSIKAGRFLIEDLGSIAWSRIVESWECREGECYEGGD